MPARTLPKRYERWYRARIGRTKVAHGLARYAHGNRWLDEVVDPCSGRHHDAGGIEIRQGSHAHSVSHIDAARKGRERTIGSDDAGLRLEHAE